MGKRVRLAGLESEAMKIKIKDITLYPCRNDMLEIEHLRIDLHLRLKKNCEVIVYVCSLKSREYIKSFSQMIKN